jgi:protein tyrosine kinase modulator
MNDINFQNNLDIQEKSLADYLDAIKRRKVQLFFVFISVLIISLIVTFILPTIYKSSAIILIEQQEIPQDLVRTTVTSYADQRIQIISQRVMTTLNLKGMIDKYDLYPEERKTDPMEVVIKEMRENISLEMISADVVDPLTGRAAQATIAFSLSYKNESPTLAQKVANELVSLFLNENLKNRTETAEDANVFLQLETKKLSEQVSNLENKIAAFKERHADSLPDMVSLNLDFMDRQERELTEVTRQIRALEERKIYLTSELSQLNPVLGSFSETGERILGSKDRLKILESELVSLEARYSEQHPDVIKLKKEISALEKEAGSNSSKSEIAIRLKQARADLATMRDKYSNEHPDIKKAERVVKSLEDELINSKNDSIIKSPDEEPDNPAYIQLQAQLEAVDTEMKSFKEKEIELRDRIDDYERRLTSSPQVEREYRSLLREYENKVLSFKEVKAKQMQAELAQTLESEKKGERFTLIEPPLRPEEPASPNRLSLALLGFVLSFAAGFVSVIVVEGLDSGIYGRRGVQAVLGQAPLSVIPYIETDVERRRRYRNYIFIITAIMMLFIISLLVFHFYIKPLDVTWFIISRKLGL